MHHIRNYQRHGAEVGSHVIRLNMFLDFDMDLVVISIFMSSQFYDCDSIKCLQVYNTIDLDMSVY